MSAYLCNPAHIGILAQALAAKTTYWGDASTIAHALATENINSVAYRYRMSADEAAMDSKGKVAATYIEECKTKATKSPNQFTTVRPHRLLGMIRCSEYQSCEHPEWHESQAREMLHYLFNSAVNAHMEATGPDMGWEYSGN